MLRKLFTNKITHQSPDVRVRLSSADKKNFKNK